MAIELEDVNDGTVAQDMAGADRNFDIIEPYLDEIVAGRDGETSLLAQVNALQALIAALAAGNSPLTEYLAERLVLMDGIKASSSATVLQLQADDSYAYFMAMAF